MSLENIRICNNNRSINNIAIRTAYDDYTSSGSHSGATIHWHKYIELQEFKRADLPKPHDWGDVTCEELFLFKWKEEYSYCGDWLGYLGVDNNIVTYSFIKPMHRNKRLGSFMYNFVLNSRGQIHTKFDWAHESAQKIWLNLINKYKYRIKDKYLCVYDISKE